MDQTAQTAELALHGPATVGVTGLSHRVADVELRERFAVPRERIASSLEAILDRGEVREAVLVSTCNRLEIVTAGPTMNLEAGIQEAIAGFLEDVSGVGRDRFGPSLYHYAGRPAVSHIFRVASGLDSLVLGEPQILGQLKEAFRTAQSVGATSSLLTRLFSRAFGVAKTIRTRTNIGRNAVSVCYAAKELAAHIFGDLARARVMLLGAGEVGALAVKHFHAARVSEIFIVNKTLERALELANEYRGVPLSFSHLEHFLPQADIIIGACALESGAETLVNQATAKRAAKLRAGTPQFYLDLAVPRNFSSEIGELSDVFLYNIDDLKETVQRNLTSRALEVDRAEEIITDEVTKFCDWLDRRSVDRTIGEVIAGCTAMRQQEVDKTLRRLRRTLSAEQLTAVKDALDDLSRSILAKTLHRPITLVRSRADREAEVVENFREMFLGRKRPNGD